MQLNFFFQPLSIAEVFGSAYRKGGLSKTDRLELMFALVNNTLTLEERLAIDRLLYSVRRGKLQLLD